MRLHGFADELSKLAASGRLPLGRVVAPRLPLHSLGALVRRGLRKRASGLGDFHEEAGPPAPEVRPDDASTRLPNASPTASQIRPGRLGSVTSSTMPVDRVSNRASGLPSR